MLTSITSHRLQPIVSVPKKMYAFFTKISYGEKVIKGQKGLPTPNRYL